MCFLKSPIVRYLQQHKCHWSKVKNKNTIWHTDKHHDMLQLLCCSVSIVALIFVSLWQHMNLINYVWAAGALSFIHQLKIYIYILVLLFFCCYCDSWGSSNISITFRVKKKCISCLGESCSPGLKGHQVQDLRMSASTCSGVVGYKTCHRLYAATTDCGFRQNSLQQARASAWKSKGY